MYFFYVCILFERQNFVKNWSFLGKLEVSIEFLCCFYLLVLSFKLAKV